MSHISNPYGVPSKGVKLPGHKSKPDIDPQDPLGGVSLTEEERVPLEAEQQGQALAQAATPIGTQQQFLSEEEAFLQGWIEDPNKFMSERTAIS